MKAILSFILIMIFAGLESQQLPPKYIYALTGCEAPLPDYTTGLTVTDNCTVSSVTQEPLPGFTLSATNMITGVTIKATDNSGNSSEVQFTVTLLDTLPPVIKLNDSLIAMNQINNIYDVGDRLMGLANDQFDNIFISDSLPAFVPDSAYYKKMLVVISRSLDNGKRDRVAVFADTVRVGVGTDIVQTILNK